MQTVDVSQQLPVGYNGYLIIRKLLSTRRPHVNTHHHCVSHGSAALCVIITHITVGQFSTLKLRKTGVSFP